MFLGLDRPRFPGLAILRSLRTCTPVSFVALPLAGEWLAAAPALRELGWGLAPLYRGETSNGAADALAAARLARAAGLASTSVIYLDIRGTYVDYVAAWTDELRDNTAYWPGLRCSHPLLARQFGELPIWMRNAATAGRAAVDPSAFVPPSPAGSGFSAALAWQYRESNPGPLDLVWQDNETVRLPRVGLVSSVVRDPSELSLTQPKDGGSVAVRQR
ncbi:glycoside hydrolase domain-containing protein [Fodinicola acaciae]|uniref:glycoside hydrolase domain-containing protein n=1 Tax=Fodinicola acaciae TaxID=2681555 RepID=UPI0013D14F89|nr:glycoside hydrolase domain-containing protein [Fodinicola acaciae]